jgi:hypothetical protein
MGDVFITHSGREIDINNISTNDICLDDIAHHLTKWCRYSGALDFRKHYSVANHSLALFYYALDNGLDYHIQRRLLLHDATEAYLGDMNGSIKPYLNDYKILEKKVDGLIIAKYGLVISDEIDRIVKELDKRILLDEAKAFFPSYYHVFKRQAKDTHPLGIRLFHESDLSMTKTLFLHTCEMLDIKD